LHQFLSTYDSENKAYLDIKDVTFSNISINGAYNIDDESHGCNEANLDIQQTISLTYPTENVVITIPNLDVSEVYDTLSPSELVRRPHLPSVISISWGDAVKSYSMP